MPGGSDSVDTQIIVNSGEVSVVYEEDFGTGYIPAHWTELDPSGNITWSQDNEALLATVTGGSGYSQYYEDNSWDISSISEVAIEYDITFEDGATYGGLWYRGIYLDTNRSRVGWRDSSYTHVTSPMTSDTTHHVIVFVHADNTSDVYVDGVPMITGELIDSAFTNNTVGFVSPYYAGSVRYDNLKVHDLGLLGSASPYFVYYNFEEGDFDGWIMSGNTSNINWTISNGQLSAEASSSGYAYIWDFEQDVSGIDVTIEYDVTFLDGADWGGLYYRNIYLDANPTRIGWRDDNRAYVSSPITSGTTHHVKVEIQLTPSPTSDIYIDDNLILDDEPIDSSFSSGNTSVGFVSNYYGGQVLFDNFSITEN